MTKAIWLGSVLALLTTTSTAMADTVFMTVRGSRQGDIQGGGTQRGREGAMQCTSYQSQIAVPQSAATGGAAARPQIEPIRCVKRVDRASPLLLNALMNNEPLTTVTFSFSQTSPDGTEPVVYTVALRNAVVTSVRQSLDAAGLAQEELAFSYQQATVTFVQGGVTAEIRR